jgi:hypothetical protein
VCVLFSEYFSDEYAKGILNNQPYRQKYESLKTQSLNEKFRNLWQRSYYAWDFVGKSLFKAKTNAAVRSILEKESQNQMNVWLDILSEAWPAYRSIWEQAEHRIKEYAREFSDTWNLTQSSVLPKMSEIAKLSWAVESINVHFVECVNGASSWADDIVMACFPDTDVEKKLLSHEIAHILAPDYLLKTKLQSLKLDDALAHTIVDLIAYFSVKNHLANPERRGMKPNPHYCLEVSRLYPIFEDAYDHPNKYGSFDDILRQIKL